MNEGLLQSDTAIVLFLDDDIEPAPNLLEAHYKAHSALDAIAVAGQVIQPWEEPLSPELTQVDHEHIDPDEFRFNSSQPGWVRRVMAGNLSVKRAEAIELGGFDENFKGAAYRFEAEFAERAIQNKHKIYFEPKATVKHKKHERGGTRTYGSFYNTLRPYHSVGAYYYLFRVTNVEGRFWKVLIRLTGSFLTKYHLKRPWLIPRTLVSEIIGLFWGMVLCVQGPKLITKTTMSSNAR